MYTVKSLDQFVNAGPSSPVCVDLQVWSNTLLFFSTRSSDMVPPSHQTGFNSYVIVTGCILLTEMCIIETLYCTDKKGSVLLLWTLKRTQHELWLLCFWSQIQRCQHVHHDDGKRFLRLGHQNKKGKITDLSFLNMNIFLFLPLYES